MSSTSTKEEEGSETCPYCQKVPANRVPLEEHLKNSLCSSRFRPDIPRPNHGRFGNTNDSSHATNPAPNSGGVEDSWPGVSDDLRSSCDNPQSWGSLGSALAFSRRSSTGFGASTGFGTSTGFGASTGSVTKQTKDY